ncbi:MAG: hypothetical protein JXA95_14890 [Spirochaetales bacterium]|nr:hypothetical protein [Spirochaetales bacterium]
MSDSAQRQFVFFSPEKDDEFDEDIDNYDNELFNVYDDGISLVENIWSDELEEDDDDLIEDDDPTLPLFDRDDLDELEEYDDMDEE